MPQATENDGSTRVTVPRVARQVSMAAAETAAEAAVARAAAQDGLPSAATEAFEPPLLLLPFRASELPPEVKQRTDALVESNMRAIYDASGWSEENEAPEGANGEVLYLLLFQHPADTVPTSSQYEHSLCTVPLCLFLCLCDAICVARSRYLPMRRGEMRTMGGKRERHRERGRVQSGTEKHRERDNQRHTERREMLAGRTKMRRAHKARVRERMRMQRTWWP